LYDDARQRLQPFSALSPEDLSVAALKTMIPILDEAESADAHPLKGKYSKALTRRARKEVREEMEAARQQAVVDANNAPVVTQGVMRVIRTRSKAS
jgi:DNA-binding transcriptional regulator YbjK